MKTIARYIGAYFNEEWNKALFALVGVFLLASFSINYLFDFEGTIIHRLQNPIEQFVFYFFFYLLPFGVTIAIYAVTTHRSDFVRNPGFWRLTFFCFVLLAAYITLHNVPAYAYAKAPQLFDLLLKDLRWYSVRYTSNLLPGVIVVLPIAMYWYSKDKADSRLYGFSSSNINLKTYGGIILLLLPVVFAASFSGDFQTAYPRYKFGLPGDIAGPERAAFVGVFELCYGVDFVVVEFFFRGFIVMAFARYLGKGSILPMVAVYAFIHFQKPLGEAIGSIAGGLVLGIVSYETRSIYGGIMLHLGVAYIMEIAGTFQLLMRKIT